jgi:hypothetical protein
MSGQEDPQRGNLWDKEKDLETNGLASGE